MLSKLLSKIERFAQQSTVASSSAMGGFRKFKIGEWEFKTMWLISIFTCLIATILAIVALAGTSRGWFSAKFDNGLNLKYDIGTRETCYTLNPPGPDNSNQTCKANSKVLGSDIGAAGNTALAMTVFSVLLGICWVVAACLITISIGPQRLWQITLIGTIVTIVVMTLGWVVFIAVIQAKKVKSVFPSEPRKSPSIESRFGVAVASSVFFGITAALMGWGRILDVDHAVMKGDTPYGAH